MRMLLPCRVLTFRAFSGTPRTMRRTLASRTCKLGDQYADHNHSNKSTSPTCLHTTQTGCIQPGATALGKRHPELRRPRNGRHGSGRRYHRHRSTSSTRHGFRQIFHERETAPRHRIGCRRAGCRCHSRHRSPYGSSHVQRLRFQRRLQQLSCRRRSDHRGSGLRHLLAGIDRNPIAALGARFRECSKGGFLESLSVGSVVRHTRHSH